MSTHFHVYKASPGRRWYSHARGMVTTRQAAQQWAARNIGGAFRVFACDGSDCPGGQPVEVMAERSRLAPDPRRRLDRNTRALIRRRADAAGVQDVNEYIRSVLQEVAV